MNLTKIKKGIVDNLQPYFEDYLKKNKNVDFETGVNLLMKSISGQHELKSAFEKRYGIANFNEFPNARSILAIKLETFFRNIFRILDKKIEGKKMLAACLKMFFREFNLLNYEDINKFFEKNENYKPTYKPEYFKNKMPFGEDFKKAYDMRNKIIHENDMPNIRTLVSDIDDLAKVYLMIVFSYYNRLDTVADIDYSFYLTKVIQRFDDWENRFMPLSSQTYVSIDIADEIDIRKEIEELRTYNVENLRKNENKTMLWGDAGTGKTSVFQFVSKEDALKIQNIIKQKKKINYDKCKIPVYIVLQTLINKNISLKQTIFDELEIPATEGEVLLNKGAFCFFLDGADEIQENLRKIRYTEIQNLLDNYEKNVFLISSRSQKGNPFNGLSVFQLQRLNNKRMKFFLKKNSTEETYKKISKEFRKNERLKRIVSTPLLLSQLIQIVETKGKIPQNEGNIVRDFIEKLLEREFKQKKNPFFDEENRKIIFGFLRELGHFSLEMKGQKATMNEQEIIYVFKEHAKENNLTNFNFNYLMQISIQLTILERKQDNLISFSHQAYQDYFHSEKELLKNGLWI